MIQMTVEQLKSYNKSSIDKLLSKTTTELDYRKKLHARVDRKSDQSEIMGMGGKKTIVPFEYNIKGIGQGYLGGKEPIYTVAAREGDTEQDFARCKEYKRMIDDICRYNDCQATHLDLVGDFLETTAAYLYIYENKQNQIVHARLDPLQTCGIWDYSTPSNLIGVIRTWTQKDADDKNQTVIELITDTERTQYVNSSGKYTATDVELLRWNDVPAVAFEKEGITAIFEPAITLIDYYEQLANNIGSMTQYNDNAKLVMQGYTFEHPATTEDKNGNMIPNPDRKLEEKTLMEAVALTVGDQGSISWLLKNVDYGGILDVMKTVQTLIMFVVASPDTTDTTFTAAESSLALRLKMFPFELRVAITKAIFRKGYLRQIEIETNRLNLRGNNFDFTRVNVELPANIPSDVEKSVAMAGAMKSSGLFSDKTCIQKSGVDVDPDQEMKQRQTEQDEEYRRISDSEPEEILAGDTVKAQEAHESSNPSD